MRETVSEEVKAIERGRREKSVRARGFEERKRERAETAAKERKDGKGKARGETGGSDRMDKTRRNGKSMRRRRGEKERASIG